MKAVLAVLAFLVVCSCLAAAQEDDEIVLSPFAEETSNSEYKAAEWHFDIPLFVLGIGGYWTAREAWPSTVKEVEAGFVLWAAKQGLTEEDKGKAKEMTAFSDTFEIAEIIPMDEGVAYRLVFRKGGVSVSGLVVLKEATSAEEVVKSAHYSENFARIVNSVPF